MKRIAAAAVAGLLFAPPLQAYVLWWPSVRYSDFCELQVGMTRAEVARALGGRSGDYGLPWEPSKWKVVERKNITWPSESEHPRGPHSGETWRVYPRDSFPRQINVQWDQSGRAYGIYWKMYAPR
jgi:hypothetical protein